VWGLAERYHVATVGAQSNAPPRRPSISARFVLWQHSGLQARIVGRINGALDPCGWCAHRPIVPPINDKGPASDDCYMSAGMAKMAPGCPIYDLSGIINSACGAGCCEQSFGWQPNPSWQCFWIRRTLVLAITWLIFGQTSDVALGRVGDQPLDSAVATAVGSRHRLAPAAGGRPRTSQVGCQPARMICRLPPAIKPPRYPPPGPDASERLRTRTRHRGACFHLGGVEPVAACRWYTACRLWQQATPLSPVPRLLLFATLRSSGTPRCIPEKVRCLCDRWLAVLRRSGWCHRAISPGPWGAYESLAEMWLIFPDSRTSMRGGGGPGRRGTPLASVTRDSRSYTPEAAHARSISCRGKTILPG